MEHGHRGRAELVRVLKQCAELDSLRARLAEVAAERDDLAVRCGGAEAERDVAEGLLAEVYEGQNAACVGSPAPCDRCLWCRVRSHLRGRTDR